MSASADAHPRLGGGSTAGPWPWVAPSSPTANLKPLTCRRRRRPSRRCTTTFGIERIASIRGADRGHNSNGHDGGQEVRSASSHSRRSPCDRGGRIAKETRDRGKDAAETLGPT